MSKPKVPTWVYKNRKLIGQFNSIADAANHTKDTKTSAALIIYGKSKMSKRGYIYSRVPLSEEEIQKLPLYERHNNDCKEQLSPKQVITVDCTDRQVFFLERSREGRKKQLEQFITNHLEYRWMTCNQKVAKLEQRFVRELLDSL